MSDNSNLSFSVEIPSLGRVIDAPVLYFVEGGHVNFDGEAGSMVAGTLLARAEEEFNELSGVVDTEISEYKFLRERIEDQHVALSTSIDADTHRSVTEEARRLRQEVALIKLNPENRARVTEHDIDVAEVEFDELRALADGADIERYERLFVTARRCSRDLDFEAATYALDEMRAIRFKIIAAQPHFVLAVFDQMAKEDFLAVDQSVHRQLVADGVACVDANDMSGLRQVIRGFFNNRVAIEVSGPKIVELAHLLK